MKIHAHTSVKGGENITFLSWVAWFKLPWLYTALWDGCRKNCIATAGIWVTFTLTVHYLKGQDLSGSPSYFTSRHCCSNSKTVNYHFWPTVSWHENPGFGSTKYDTGLVCWVKRNEKSHTDLIIVTPECSGKKSQKVTKNQKLPKTSLKKLKSL